MITMGIKEAAEFLRIHPVTLNKMAKSGHVPAMKPGKQWVFVDIDLLEWMRAKYIPQADVGDQNERSNACHFSNAKAHQTGGSKLLPPTESDYSKVLGLR